MPLSLPKDVMWDMESDILFTTKTWAEIDKHTKNWVWERACKDKITCYLLLYNDMTIKIIDGKLYPPTVEQIRKNET